MNRRSEAATLPLFFSADPQRPIAWRHGAPVLLAEFQIHVAGVVAQLPKQSASMINLCEDRYRFLVAYAAAMSVGHTVLLPASRAEQVVADVQSTNAGSYRMDDVAVGAALAAQAPTHPVNANIPADMTVMVGHTSGSTGQPKKFPKLLRTVSGSNARNAETIRAALPHQYKGETVWLLATVPPQHMYGMEMSVLLPLSGDMAVHAGRPLFPADIAAALAELPRPRVLVSTPVHLRAIAGSLQDFPQVDVIVSATAPLDQSLAAAVTAKLGGELVEMFGSTETCVFASRCTAREGSWRLYDGVRLEPHAEGTLVHAPWFVEPVLLQDRVELQEGDRFVVRGRSSDMIEVAGKRASLSDLTRRLLAIEGVQEAAVFQPDADAVGTIRRVAALVVAPTLTSREVLERLAAGVDSAFLPRPLVMVDKLPRNELGKLPRESLMRALRRE